MENNNIDLDDELSNILNSQPYSMKSIEKKLIEEDVKEQAIVNSFISNETKNLMECVKTWDKSIMVCKPVPVKKPLKMRVANFLNKLKNVF